MLCPERGVFVGKTKYFDPYSNHMKKGYIVLATVLSLLVYILPIITQAGSNATADPTLAPAALTAASLTTPEPIPAIPTPFETLKMRITAYASVPDETSDHPFITASGEHVRDGIVAANNLPFGTEIELPGLFGKKIFTVEDRTSNKVHNTVDIWMSTVGDAIYFGAHNNTTVVVLSEPGVQLAER
jgi:3D (Asp-Asp-Asp) domain-containing protein